jgi:nicotinamide-nucleotide amidase
MAMADDPLVTLAARLGTTLTQRGWTMALAESCTGGMASQYITAVPGSSSCFERGFVTYSNSAKIELLGVSAETLERCGAVSEETAREMAKGALQHSHVQLTGAITGVAGPDGGTPDKPVGMVCFAWAGPDGALHSETHYFDGDRDAIRRQSVETIYQGLLRLANGST